MMEGYADTKTILGGHLITLSGGCIFLDGIKTTSSTKSIIDDALLLTFSVQSMHHLYFGYYSPMRILLYHRLLWR